MPKWFRATCRWTVLPVLIAVAVVGALMAGVAHAQSPTPTWFMEDSYPGNAYPSGANAVVVEGLGSIGCSYSQASIEGWTVDWTNDDLQVATEISPQSGCGSISQYESLISGIKSHVESYGNNPGRYWAGFMLDEEPGFGFSASQLETLNSYVQNLMGNTPGMSWYFEEDQPNGWALSTYNSILASSWPAGQAYTSSMVSSMNGACSSYGDCTNAVTVDSYAASPWDSPSYVTGLVSGTPWSDSYWGTGNWYNLWRDG